MNALLYIIRPRWSLVLAALLLATGCHSAPFGRRTATAPTPSPQSPTPSLGTSLDDIDARNRADIAAQLGRPVAPGPATPQEVAAMARAHVDPRLIICYINRSTNVAPIGAQDVIYLHEQGVDEHVIQAMLTPGAADSRLEVARAMPPRTIIITDPYWPDYYPYPYPQHYGVAVGYGYGRHCY